MQQKHLQLYIPPLQLTLYSLALGGLLTIMVFSAGGFLSRSFALPMLLLTGEFWLSISAALFCLIVGSSHETKNNSLTMATLAAAGLALTDLIYSESAKTTQIYFLLTTTCQSMILYGLGKLTLSTSALSRVWVKLFCLAYLAVFWSFAGIGLIAQSWIEMERSLAYQGVVRNLLIALGPLLAIMSVSALSPIQRPKPTTKMGFPSNLAQQKGFSLTGILSFACLLGLITQLYCLLSSQGSLLGIHVNGLSFAWLGGMMFSFHKSKEAQKQVSHQRLSTALTPPAAQRLLQRHFHPNKYWATTVGLRSPGYIINHDPDGHTSEQLPATIAQIRQKEIEDSIGRILGPTSLYQRVVGTEVFGTIDPELSVRPCVDVLCLFACMHLDVSQYVERRLKGLISLLPILDPEVLDQLNPQDLDRMISREQWLYHFDFGWVDQHMVRSQGGISYEISQNLGQSTFRQKVFDFLKERNRVGNFAWVGPEARQRLVQEAPMLAQIIQAWPVPVEGEEHLVFLIRFEELIPRLQKYFQLEKWRAQLQDYEPSQESIQYLNLLELEIRGLSSVGDLKRVLKALSAFRWSGYREKDLALHVILRAFDRGREIIVSTKGASEEKISKELEALRSRFINAIGHVGYPNQLLHKAQLSKRAIRSPKLTIESASSPWNPRFQESWLHIATGDANRLPPESLHAYLKFLNLVPDLRALNGNLFVQCKSIEAFVNLGSCLKSSEESILEATLNKYAVWLAQAKAPVEIITLFIDSHRYLELKFGVNLVFDSEAKALINQHLQYLCQNDPDAKQSISSRLPVNFESDTAA